MSQPTTATRFSTPRFALLVLAGAYPVITAVLYLIIPLTGSWAIWQRTLLVAPMMVAAMIWVVIPQVRKRFHAFINPVVAAALALFANGAGAQGAKDTVVAPSWQTGSMNLQFGTGSFGLNDLNRSMTANGRPAFATSAASIGISGYARFDKFIIGGTGESGIPQRQQAGGWINKIWYGTAMIDGGYALIEGPTFLLYPQASIGMKHSVLKIERTGDFTFDAAVNDPTRGVSMSSWRALAGYGVVGELRLSSRATGDFSIGVRGGYSTPLGGAHTSSGESSVSGSPSEESGAYLRLSVGKPLGKRRNAMSVLSTVLVPMIVR